MCVNTAAAETKDKEDGTKVEGDDACEVKQVVPVVTRRKNFDSPSHRKKPVWKFTRSSSLTCTELVEDINVSSGELELCSFFKN